MIPSPSSVVPMREPDPMEIVPRAEKPPAEPPLKPAETAAEKFTASLLGKEPEAAPLVNDPPMERSFTEGLFRKPVPSVPGESLFGKSLGQPSESVWTRDKSIATAPLFATVPAVPVPVASAVPVAPPVPSPNSISIVGGSLVDKAARLKMFEPGKSLFSKSMVKTPEGEVISEYFYSPLHPKDSRQYIFNSLYALWSLLSLKARDEEAFQDRLETVFADLLSRLEHGQNIHLESFLNQEINKDTLSRLMAAPRSERGKLFDSMVARLLSRIESVGPGRAGLIDHQFQHLPKTEFPPRNGLTA